METPWHRFQMNLLIDSIEMLWRGRKDFYSGGNMFLYFSETYAKNKNFKGPDFFVVKNVDHDRKRKYWATWLEEARFPDVIVELLSATTKKLDLGEKKDVYERTFRTSEYFCHDPDDQVLRGWRLQNLTYVPIKPDKAGRLWCEQLDVFLGPWEGEYMGQSDRWIRFFTTRGRLVKTHWETADAKAIQQEARADQEAARATQETARANQESARANQAEAEIARLKEELTQTRRRNGKHK